MRAVSPSLRLLPVVLSLLVARTTAAQSKVSSRPSLGAFTRNTPEPEARRLNATFEVGTGLRIARRRGRALLLGWKFHHLSNAWTAPYNPGLDGNVFYVGFQQR